MLILTLGDCLNTIYTTWEKRASVILLVTVNYITL
jgi:hypothetical protein